MAKKSLNTFAIQLPDQSTKNLIKKAKGFEIQGAAGQPTSFYSKGGVASVPITKNAQFAGSGANVAWTQPMFFSPLHTPQNWQIASKRREVYQWARFYYENEPKVAAAIDFYAQFPINGFKLECKSTKVKKYFERVVDRLELNTWFKKISHEYFLLGDVFVFLDIDCPHCGGSGATEDGESCNHPDGTFKRILILNPDWVEVSDNQLADEPLIALLPDEELKAVVMKQQPKQIYDRLPNMVKQLVLMGRPIPLSNRSVSHMKHGGAPYGVYGESMLRRLFTILAYKTKLMTANWIIAERLILPIRVVKVGDKDRPAQADDIADTVSQLAAVANDPNLTIVTHHAFDYEWYGATGRIHNITNEVEQIGKEVLDGVMLNQALLNGEMGGYQNAQVGVETMIRRLQSWRDELAEWAEKNIFLPIAQMQGFIDEEETKTFGEPVYIYPKIRWNDLRLRDKTNELQMYMQMYDKGMISMRFFLDQFDIDYDQMIKERREEQLSLGMGAMGMGMAGGPPGGMPPGGGLGGMGGPPMGGDMGAPMGGPPMGGDMGGGMGGAPMGGAPGGGMGAAASGGAGGGGEAPLKVYKKGKGPKQSSTDDETAQMMQQTQMVHLTGPEIKIYKALQGLQVPYQLYAQFKVAVPGNPQPYNLDFAYPDVGVNIEADGEKWHTSEEDRAHDRERDVKLAQMGWTCLRFTEEAINERMDEVQKAIQDTLVEAAKHKRAISKKAQSPKEWKNVKYAMDIDVNSLGAKISGVTSIGS